MTGDQYLQNILTRENVSSALLSPARAVQMTLSPVLTKWGGQYLHSVTPSGSFAKGTANRSGTDIDLFISLHDFTKETLKEIHDSLETALSTAGYTVRRQNVSLNTRVGSFDVDLVPGKRHDAWSGDHSLYRRKAGSWTKTNVQTHINHVIAARRANEIRIIKLWRNQKGLDFPSFYLELAVIEALRGQLIGGLAERVMKVFEYLRDRFPNARFVDPANTGNIISDDLTVAERQKISAAAKTSRSAPYWEHIVT